jgi:GxxExxY protein
MDENQTGTVIIETALMIHRELGSGLLESVYEAILARLLVERGLHVERQVPVPILFRGMKFDEAFRVDLMVNGKVIVELKSVEKINNSHKKQLLTYLRLTNLKLGYLFNFNEALFKDGITRVVNGLPE